MARPRELDPYGLYHVTSRGNYRQSIFPDDEHRERFLERLAREAQRRSWLVLDYCLLPNHFHLLIQLDGGGLSEGMRGLNGGYSRWANARSERTGTGHLVKNRFGGKLVETDGHLVEIVRYIPLNPVKAGLASTAADWRWSGYRAALGLEHPRSFHRPDLVLRYFHGEPAEARRRLARLVDDGHVLLRRVWGQTTVSEAPRD